MNPTVRTAAESPIDCDLLVVGGGVNGAGIARDAAGRGLRVVLCERDDLAQHTSSASTKLIHGGLRYLEHREFGLVRKALQEREVLLRNAPHIMWPLRFVLPHDPSMRPVWMMRLGLFLYDHLARREWLAGSRAIHLDREPVGAALQPEFRRGFVYSDGWVDDARLVVLSAVDAALQGARVFTRTAVRRAQAVDGLWHAQLQAEDGTEYTVRARAMVNATGQWAAQFLQDRLAGGAKRRLRLIKGSHMVVRRLFDHDHAYILQNPDGRIVFAIPYEQDFTLIGTTDVEQRDADAPVECSDEEVQYLCTLINRYFRKPVRPEDVVWRYAGVRPLLDDESGNPAAITRDYRLELTGSVGTAEPPVLSVWGGKITTARKLAEEAVDQIAPLLKAPRGPWTLDTPLPGGDFRSLVGALPKGDLGFEALVKHFSTAAPWLPDALLRRYVRAYGTRTTMLLDGATALADLGEEWAPGLYAAEVAYLRRYEWVTRADDLLWRRSKLGLHLTEAQRQAVAKRLQQTGSAPASAPDPAFAVP